MTLRTAAILAGTLLSCTPAWANPLQPTPAYGQVAPAAPAYPKATVSGLLFTDFRVPTGQEPSVTVNGRTQPRPLSSFDVTRAFLTGTAQINDVWSGVITVNSYPETYLGSAIAPPTTEAHNVILQYGYLQAKGLLPDNTTQLGLVATPFADYEANGWGYRMLADVPTRGGIGAWNNLGGGMAYLNFWDHGVRTMGSLNRLSYDFGVFNGEGFRANETDGQKNVQGRLTLGLLPGLDLSLIGYRGNPGNAQLADRALAGVKYAQGGFRIGVEGVKTWDEANNAMNVLNGEILSAYAIVPLPLSFLPSPELVLRADQYYPDLDAGAPVYDQRLESLAGRARRAPPPPPRTGSPSSSTTRTSIATTRQPARSTTTSSPCIPA